jgi:hypothetical protein
MPDGRRHVAPQPEEDRSQPHRINGHEQRNEGLKKSARKFRHADIVDRSLPSVETDLASGEKHSICGGERRRVIPDRIIGK